MRSAEEKAERCIAQPPAVNSTLNFNPVCVEQKVWGKLDSCGICVTQCLNKCQAAWAVIGGYCNAVAKRRAQHSRARRTEWHIVLMATSFFTGMAVSNISFIQKNVLLIRVCINSAKEFGKTTLIFFFNEIFSVWLKMKQIKTVAVVRAWQYWCHNNIKLKKLLHRGKPPPLLYERLVSLRVYSSTTASSIIPNTVPRGHFWVTTFSFFPRI